MQHKVKISIDDDEYKNLRKLAGRKRIEYVVKDIVSQQVVRENLEGPYQIPKQTIWYIHTENFLTKL